MMTAAQRKPVHEEKYNIHPKRFVLWLLIAAIIMLFAAFTSAYIVRKAEGRWLNFELPVMFTFTSIIIVLSSITLIWAQRAARRDEIGQLKSALICTLMLGISFCIGQYIGWQEMVAQGFYFRNAIPEEISASFVYVISGVHALHVAGGVIYLLVVLVQAYQLKVHKKYTLSIDLCATYWHVIGILWIYLFLFLYFTR